jgi:hypothetical protein
VLVSGKPMPPAPPPLPWWSRAIWGAWSWITWPLDARKLKRAGFRRTGWRKWETPGGDP